MKLQVGKLYHINQYYWLLYLSAVPLTTEWGKVRWASLEEAWLAAVYWGTRYNQTVLCIPEGTDFVLLEEHDEKNQDSYLWWRGWLSFPPWAKEQNSFVECTKG